MADDMNDEEEEKRLKNEFAITTRATQTKNFSLKVIILFVRFAYFHRYNEELVLLLI